MMNTYKVSAPLGEMRPQSQKSNRHPNYISVCQYIAIAKKANMYTLPSSRRIAAVLKISHMCVNNHLRELVWLGWVRRIENSNSRRGVTYNITLGMEEASNIIRNTTTTPTRKKKRRLETDYLALSNRAKFIQWGRG